MGIRLPLKRVLDNNLDSENGAGVAGDNGSVAGGRANEFNIPQDADNIVLKYTASIAGAGASAVLQTSPDGGTTWYDQARTSVISNAVDENAQWLSTPVIGVGLRSAVQGQASIAGETNVGVALNTIGTAAASALGQSEVSGLPVLGPKGRTFVIYAAGILSVINERVEVFVNSQSPRS